MRKIALQINNEPPKTYPIVGISKYPPGLEIRIGFLNYILVLRTNRLVKISGNRISKTYAFKAIDPEYAQRTYKEMLLESASSTLTKNDV